MMTNNARHIIIDLDRRRSFKIEWIILFLIILLSTPIQADATEVAQSSSSSSSSPGKSRHLSEEEVTPSSSVSDYNESEAKIMLQYATISYCDATTIEDWRLNTSAPKLNITAVIQDKNYALQAYIGWRNYNNINSNSNNNGRQNKQIVVGFRGTVDSEIMNWVNNIGFFHATPWKSNLDIKVHSGFYDSWTRLRPQVVQALQDLLVDTVGSSDGGNHNDIFLTGHSLGGAMACFCAYELHNEYNITAAKVYTYGKPRIGNLYFSQSFASTLPSSLQHWRKTHWKDPVPQYPWRSLGYHHVAREVFYNKESSQYVIAPIDDDGKKSNGQSSICNDFFCLEPSDHTFYLNITTGDTSCPYDKSKNSNSEEL